VNVVWAIESIHRNWRPRHANRSAKVELRRVSRDHRTFSEPSEKKTGCFKKSSNNAHEPTLKNRMRRSFYTSSGCLKKKKKKKKKHAPTKACGGVAPTAKRHFACGRLPCPRRPKPFPTELQDLTDALASSLHASPLSLIVSATDQLVGRYTKADWRRMKNSSRASEGWLECPRWPAPRMTGNRNCLTYRLLHSCHQKPHR